ncbi:hypothetical protein BRADI_1g14325v3 [Brachypodium distachyon]|uniref:Uncharacterized protein n=1 Tax=Brachypodium distachyon TaxID=15368 RepID=A0A0Q3GT95_BRADI|nr:hypothetical protein BRADI_1g14325v3 [Brachypodium distachyon]
MALGLNSRPSCFTHYFWWHATYTNIGRNCQVIGLAAICWAIWKLRDRACFEKKLIRSPVETICLACSFLKYWPGLQGGDDDTRLCIGADILQREALKHHPAQARLDLARIQGRNPDERC